MPNDTIWITALTSGLAGAVITLLGQCLLRWWNRPILEIVFRNEPGCRVPLPEGVVFLDKGNLLRDEHGNPRRGTVLYLRLKIENRGKTFAKNASVCVTKIKYEAAGTGKKSFEEEVFELKLAPTALNPFVFNIAASGHRFLDLVHTVLDDKGHLDLIFDFGEGAHRLAALNMRSGDYVVTVFASAGERQIHQTRSPLVIRQNVGQPHDR